MRLRHLLTLVAFLLAIAGIVGYAGVLLRRDRAALVDELARERLTLLQEAARRFESELADIADSVRFAATLAHRPGPVAELQREMAALVEVIGQFKELSIYDASGERRLDVVDRGAPGEVRHGGFARVLAEGAGAPTSAPATSPRRCRSPSRSARSTACSRTPSRGAHTPWPCSWTSSRSSSHWSSSAAPPTPGSCCSARTAARRPRRIRP